jgi:capsular polysaccharide biosynthesis protein
MLALFATGSLIGSAIFIFDVEPAVMLNFFIGSLLGLLVIVLAAFVFSLLRRLFKRRH